MAELPVTEPAETRIDEPEGSLDALAGVPKTTGPDDEREWAREWDRLKAAEVARSYPDCLTAWAVLGENALVREEAIDAYAYFRVGYHRGLDRLRKSGWRGSGRVPWAHEPNRGFLRSLRGLGRAAAAIGEGDEAARCREFFATLAPDAPED